MAQDPHSTDSPQDPNRPSTQGKSLADGDLTQPIKLREFLHGLAPLFRLPKRAPKPVEPPAEAKPGFRLSLPQLPKLPLLPLAGVCAAVLLFMASKNLFAGQEDVPDDLVGSYNTSAPKYADRGFDIAKTSVVFHKGPGVNDTTMHLIKGVKSSKAHGGTHYVISYLVEDKEATLDFIYNGSGSITLTHQAKISWEKVTQKASQAHSAR